MRRSSNQLKTMRYVRSGRRSSCGRNEELRSCKSNVGRSVYRRTCGDSTTKAHPLELQEKNIMSVYVPEMHFTVKDETEESEDFKYGY